MLFNKKEARILVVDDDRQLADTLTEFLTKLGYQAATAYGGREGLDKFEQGDFQLVITDLMMPEMDGMELLEMVTKLDSRTMVIIITDFPTIASAVEAIKKGAYDYISKPFKMEELEIIVKRALEKHTVFSLTDIFHRLKLRLSSSRSPSD